MRIFVALGCAATLLVPQSTLARGGDEVTALAVCAWDRVPATAAVLSEKKAKKRVIYDEPEIEGAGPFMRVYAACEAERAALVEAPERSERAYLLLKAIRKVKPDTVPDETFHTTVYRCTANFADKSDLDQSPMIWWGYGEDRSASQLGSKKSVFNNQVSITAADLAALEQRGDGLQKMLDLLEQAEKQDTLEVETYGEGIASEKAFVIKATEANTSCQIVTPEGELANA